MKSSSSRKVAFVLLALFFTAGCATTASRIKDHQAAFDASPADVQAKIQAGQVAVGFSQEQVTMALGDPDRRYTRTTARGASEIWAYEDSKPGFSLGLGVAGGGGSTSVGSGIAIGNGDRRDDKLRVILEGGRVVAVETLGRP